MEAELKNEISLVEKWYKILKDYLSGAEYEISEIRGCIHSLKDSLSKVRILLLYYFATKGKVGGFPIDDLLEQMDIALIMIERYPQQARVVIQTALALSPVKIENVMAFLDFIKKQL